MNAASTQSGDYARIAAAIQFLQKNQERQPRLDDLAQTLGLSSFHLQRLFQRWAGISPKRFLQVLTLQRSKELLQAETPVLETAIASGLSGPGRLHELFVTLEAMTPGEFGRGGEGVNISYGFHASPFGTALLALTERGVCGLAFADAENQDIVLTDLRRHWPLASWQHNPRATHVVAARIFDRVQPDQPLAVLVHGTNFQVQVWRALLRIPEGQTSTYSAVAHAAGRPNAIRAAASAIGDNPVSWLIPCHRVIRRTGALGGYRWGLERKTAMQLWEAARLEEAEPSTSRATNGSVAFRQESLELLAENRDTLDPFAPEARLP